MKNTCAQDQSLNRLFMFTYQLSAADHAINIGSLRTIKCSRRTRLGTTYCCSHQSGSPKSATDLVIQTFSDYHSRLGKGKPSLPISNWR